MPELVIQRQRQQAKYFTQDLGSNVGLDMILIPGGRFLMGSPESEPERRANEGPQHEVTVPAFFMGRYPVTQTQWRVVAGYPQANRELNPDPSDFKGDNHPVENVSWFEAVEFCDRLSQYTTRDYHLPAEAEWEYACRAGTTTPFYFGQTITTELVNYDGNYTYANGSKGVRRGKTNDVDHFTAANAFGLHDMHGNVWEWCQDYWHNNYQDAPADGSAWLSENDNDYRVVRGGSWGFNPEYCRSAFRSKGNPGFHGSFIGFRVVLPAPRALR